MRIKKVYKPFIAVGATFLFTSLLMALLPLTGSATWESYFRSMAFCAVLICLALPFAMGMALLLGADWREEP